MNLLPVAEFKDIVIRYGKKTLLGGTQPFNAVDGVSLELYPGDVLGLVGESGCGKTSLGKAIVRLVEPHSGKVLIDSIDFLNLQGEELRKKRSAVQMIFQDPYASLDPRMTVYDTLAEPLLAHYNLKAKEIDSRVREALSMVSLPFENAKRYPHEFSGGQRQRIAIARALMLKPKILIADEPVSSLDVSIQAQILNLLKNIQKQLGLSMIFISHNLSVVRYIANRVAVMYLGRIVEEASAEELFENPKHPYTQALLSAVPIPDPKIEKLKVFGRLQGEPPSPKKRPSGCAFHPRCPIAKAHCKTDTPNLEMKKENHEVSCWEVPKLN